MTDSKHVLITGASSGIGAAIARSQAARGHRLSLGARRHERLEEFADPAYRAALDVTDESSIETFLEGAIAAHGPIDVLVNNAGLARGIERVADADGVAWREMIETNVLGVLSITRRVLGSMIERESGHVLMIGSIAGRQSYEGGSVYCATKAAVARIAQSIRQETFGKNIRVTTLDPGLVETEFSLVRFRGDQDKAAAPYRGARPLSAEDIAECADFAISRPAHVNIDDMLITSTDQVTATRIYRRE